MLCYYTNTQEHRIPVLRGKSKWQKENMVNLTITMTKEERKALKQIALDKDMTVSALVREWLKEYQIQEGAEKNGCYSADFV